MTNGFIAEIIKQIESILSDLKDGKALDLKELFRFFHAIKGRARVLGFKEVAETMHEMESLISKEDVRTIDLIPRLEKIIEILRRGVKGSSYRTDDLKIEFSFLPVGLISRLSSQEKERLNYYLLKGKIILLLKRSFNEDSFFEDFSNFLKRLSECSEVLSVLPCSSLDYEFVLATEDEINMEGIEILAKFFLDRGFAEVFKTVAGYGREVASKLGKKVNFRIDVGVIEKLEKFSNFVLDLLIHLVHNAIDHGIRESGEVRIKVAAVNDEIVVRVEDNGVGIDIEKIRQKAIEKGLISEKAEFSSAELLRLVFCHGFSTTDKVSEISGRGVGLDLVSKMVEDLGGYVRVETEGSGTVFEIRFPKATFCLEN